MELWRGLRAATSRRREQEKNGTEKAQEIAADVEEHRSLTRVFAHREAWNSCAGLSRTEAKRGYITTLISTMRKYASTSADARELVSELEFVWDQVKSNVPSSSSSSPVHTAAMPASQHLMPKGRPPSFPTLNTGVKRGGEKELRVMSPTSPSQEDEAEAEAAAEEGDIFVDAPDSQVAEPAPRLESAASQQDSHDRPPGSEGVRLGRKKSYSSPSRDPKWRSRVESALVKLTAEVAAVREQLESRRLFALGRQHKIWSWLASAVWGTVKFIAFDFFLLLVVLLWLRRKKDRRLEMAIRVLLGDAASEARKISSTVQHAVVRNKK